MRFTIHDVGHGFCAHLKHDNRNVMLWDCGHKTQPEHRPSTFLRADYQVNRVHKFFVTNYDEDHISDLPSLRRSLYLDELYRNTTINADELRALKLTTGPLTSAMNSLLEMIQTYTTTVTSSPPFPGIDLAVFKNQYRTDFMDTNNLSLVTFLECPAVNAIIPGDIETAGWKKLLENSAFRDRLRRVHVFVASHHGRENGYCKEVFDYCSPSVVIFSDSPIAYATQEMAETYGRHASGVQFNGETRYVLSTRKDHTLTWSS